MIKQSAYWMEPGYHDALDEFRLCHAGIVEQFERLRLLAQLYGEQDKAAAVKAAGAFVDFFAKVILTHHEEEERDLFPAVAREAAPGDEAELVASLEKRLCSEHRGLEARWKRISPEIKRLAKGKLANVDAKELAEFADAYIAHARFEEAAFLPLSKKILGPAGISGLGLQIHAKHVLDRLPAYI